MITIIKQEQDPESKINNLPFGQEYIHSLVTQKEMSAKDFLMIPLTFFIFYNPFQILNKFGIYTDTLEKKSKYKCPFRKETTFWGLLPITLKTNDPQKYRHEELKAPLYDLVFDLKWQKHNNIVQFILENKITKSFLGHGYTKDTLPTDGSNTIIPAKLQLSNNDFIIALTWEWHNN